MSKRKINEGDLHAWADDLLADERRAEVEDWLAAHPGDAARLHDYRLQNRALRAAFDPVLEEPLPAALRRAAALPPAASSPPRRWGSAPALRAAAMVALCVLGAVAGWLGHARFGTAPASPAVAEFSRQAAIAHAVYTPEVRRPVEVDGAHEEQLVAWLSKRLGAPLHAPRLGALGFELVGGRLLPGQQGPVALFMYQDPSGQRLTLYVSGEVAGHGDAGFRFAEENGVKVFYWVDGRFGYALSAAIDKTQLARIATAVYDQLESSARR